jgi:hypothetical protein
MHLKFRILAKIRGGRLFGRGPANEYILLRCMMILSELACISKVKTTEGPITADKHCLSAVMKHKARSIGQSSRRHASEEEQRSADEGRYVRVFGQNSTDSLVGVL